MTARIRKNNVIQISQVLIDKIIALAETRKYTTDVDLYYEGHIPIVAYLIVEGSGFLFKKRRKNISLKRGDLIGLIEVLSHEPSVYGAHIHNQSEVVFLDRSTIQEVMDQDVDQELKEVFESLLSHA